MSQIGATVKNINSKESHGLHSKSIHGLIVTANKEVQSQASNICLQLALMGRRALSQFVTAASPNGVHF